MKAALATLLLPLGLASLALAAPISQVPSQISISAQVVEQSPLEVEDVVVEEGPHGTKVVETSDIDDDLDWVKIDNRPVYPSTSISADEALSAPRPLHTAYLLALSKHHKAHGGESRDDLANEEGVPDTVSPTSYARIEAGLADLYPSRTRLPCWRQRSGLSEPNPTKTRHDMIIIGAVFAVVLLAFVLELLGLTYQWIRSYFTHDGAIRLEEDETISKCPSFHCDELVAADQLSEPAEKGTVS